MTTVSQPAPLDVQARKGADMKFAPDGPTDGRDVSGSYSLADYIGRWPTTSGAGRRTALVTRSSRPNWR